MITAKVLILASLVAALISAAEAPTRPASTFGYVDLHIDPNGKPLAAWQVDFSARDNSAILVGVEAGDSPAFKDPPHYDPAALAGNRIILAAYSTAAGLPTSKTRIARLHLEFRNATRAYNVRLMTAATSDGAKLEADASVSEGVQP